MLLELLLEWIEQRENSIERPIDNEFREDSLDSRLLTAPDVARILNISKGAAYQFIQQGKIPSVRINNNVRERSEVLEEFITLNSKLDYLSY